MFLQTRVWCDSDELGRRTSVAHGGSAFTEHNTQFGYNVRSELETADRYQGTTQTTHMSSDYLFEYEYDNIGNREESSVDEAANPMTYDANDLNQYTATTYPTDSYDFDADGHLTYDGIYAYTWDAENRLILVAPVSQPVSGDKKLEFAYDYMERRVQKVYSTHNGTSWVEQDEQRFIYDGWNVVLVLDGDNDTLTKYTWGPPETG